MLLLPLLFAVARGQGHGSPYDYEYYDPATGQSLGPATAQPAQTVPVSGQAVSGQVLDYSSTPGQFPSAFGGPAVPAVVQGTAVFGPAPVKPPVSAAQRAQEAKLRELRAKADMQARTREYNARLIKRAGQDQSRLALFDSVLNPAGRSPAFAALRFRNQAKVVDALRSEKRMATNNAQLAYQRYREDPSRLNYLVSRYSDLNAELRDASLHFNILNAGTFQQSLRSTFTVFGGASLTSLLVSRREQNELEDIQDRMNRLQRQIQREVQVRQNQAKAGKGPSPAQGSAPQRLVAMNAYGPPRPY